MPRIGSYINLSGHIDKIKLNNKIIFITIAMTSAQGNRTDLFSVSNSFDKRVSVTAAESRSPPKIFTPEEMENMRLANLRQKRREL